VVHIAFLLNGLGLSITYIVLYFELIPKLIVDGLELTDPWLSNKWVHLGFVFVVTFPWIFTNTIK